MVGGPSVAWDFLKFSGFLCVTFLYFLYHGYPKNHHSNKPSISFWLGMIFSGFSSIGFKIDVCFPDRFKHFLASKTG